MSLRIVTPPASDPVTLAEAKAFLGVTDTSSDTLITGLITTATIAAQSRVQRLFVTQTVEWIMRDWRSYLCLPVAPVLASDVSFIKYYDLTNVQRTLDPSSYVVQQKGPSVIILPSWGNIWPFLSITPASEPVTVRFNAGDSVGNVKESIKTAIKFYLRHLWSLKERSLFVSYNMIEGLARQEFVVNNATLGALDDVVDSLLADQRW
jgi:uncharacterized phiE125 gp8 family phage protein